MIGAGALFLPLGVDPQFIGTVALGAQVPLGTIGLLLALVGILFAVGGAAIDTCFSGAYNLAQFFGWEWGKYRRPSGAPRFTLAWIVLLVLALLVIIDRRRPGAASPSTRSSSPSSRCRSRTSRSCSSRTTAHTWGST